MNNDIVYVLRKTTELDVLYYNSAESEWYSGISCATQFAFPGKAKKVGEKVKGDDSVEVVEVGFIERKVVK